MAGTQLLFLDNEIQVIRLQALTHQVGAMANHHMDARRAKASGGIDHVGKHRFASDRMQDFRQCRAHAGAWPAARMTISRDMGGRPSW